MTNTDIPYKFPCEEYTIIGDIGGATGKSNINRSK